MALLPSLGTAARVLARGAGGRFVAALTPTLPTLRLPGVPNYALPVRRLLGADARFRDIVGRFTTAQGAYVTELNRVDTALQLPRSLFITDGRKPRGPGSRYLYDVQLTARDRNGRSFTVERSISSPRQLTIDEVFERAEALVDVEGDGQGGSPPFAVGDITSALLGAYSK